jgi:hypothetical protein
MRSFVSSSSDDHTFPRATASSVVSGFNTRPFLMTRTIPRAPPLRARSPFRAATAFLQRADLEIGRRKSGEWG